MKSALSDFISGKKGIYGILHIIILVMSLFLVISISVDTFKGIPFYTQSSYMKVQLCICLWFLFDFVLEFFLAKHKGRYLRTHFIFLLVAIPYQNIIAYYGWTFSDEITYLLRFIPLLRGGYALAIVVGWLTYNRASGESLGEWLWRCFVVGFYGCHYRRFEYHSADGDRTCTFRFVGCPGYDDVPYLYSLYHKSDSAI